MKYSVVILCGGKSTRMGQDKALLEINGKPMIHHIYNQFKECDEILISKDKADKYIDIPGIHIIDEYENCGPLSGIVKALETMHNEWLFVVGTDMPYMDKVFADELFEKREQKDAIIPIDYKIHCVGGFYHKNILFKAKEMLSSQDYKLMNLLKKSDVKFELTDSHKLFNMNTKKDYRKLKHIPVLCVSGFSNSGKTTLCKQIIQDLKDNNIQIAYIKHTHHNVDLDTTKDNITIMNDNVKQSICFNSEETLVYTHSMNTIENIIETIDDVDLILIEGMKDSKYPKIWLTSNEDINITNRKDIIKTYRLDEAISIHLEISEWIMKYIKEKQYENFNL